MTAITTQPPLAEPTALSLHAAAYHAAVAVDETHYAAHQPATEALFVIWQAHEASYVALVDAMFGTGVAAIKAKVSDADEVQAKFAIHEAQEFQGSNNSDTILELMKAFVDDADRLEGAA